MIDTSLIAVFRLASGIMIISEFTHEEGSEHFNLYFPFELELTYDVSGHAKMYVNRYLPYSDDSKVMLSALAVESVSICSQVYREFYRNKVKQFKDLVKSLTEEKEVEEELEYLKKPEVKKKETYH